MSSISSSLAGELVYVGIGSRETPPTALESIEALARRLARGGWTLRTGMSPGADQAFYRGALAGGGRVELYLPEPGFQAHARCPREGTGVYAMSEPSAVANALAARFHPNWSALSGEELRLRARDVHQVLGGDLASPADLVLCWTQDGSVDGTGPSVGGTGQALRIAAHHGIAVLNLSRPDHVRQVSRYANLA
jgi:hypothetical protein